MKNAPLSSRTLSCLSERREEKKLSPDERRVSRDVANISCEKVRVRRCVECVKCVLWRVCVWMERWVRVLYFNMQTNTRSYVITEAHPSNVQPHDLALLLCHVNFCAESAKLVPVPFQTE